MMSLEQVVTSSFPHGRPPSRPSRRWRKKKLDGRVKLGHEGWAGAVLILVIVAPLADGNCDLPGSFLRFGLTAYGRDDGEASGTACQNRGGVLPLQPADCDCRQRCRRDDAGEAVKPDGR